MVSIPIHFVGSEKTRSDSALKIQKAFRGFRVRKNVKKIMVIRRDVDEVEKKVEERETMEVIKKDAMERLKLNESLMALLLKLDSVRGVDDGVRDFRKAVIRKVVMLQEKIDSVVAAIEDDADYSKKIDDSTSDTAVNEGETLSPIDDNAVDEGQVQASNTIDDNDADNTTFNRVNEGRLADKTSDSADNEGELGVENSNLDKMESETIDDNDADYFEFADNTTDNCVNEGRIADKTSDSAVNEGELGVENPNPDKMEAETWDCVGEREEIKRDEDGNSTKRVNDDWFVVGGEKEERKRRKERILEKMAEDNERLMTMVADLCEKNATQAIMICSLSQRVEQLEKAMNERTMRRKKKNKKNATLNGLVHDHP